MYYHGSHLSVKLHLIFFLFFETISSSIFCSCNYWTEHLRPPPSSELRQAPTSSPIVADRRCPCPWLHRSSHVQRLASSPTAAAAYLDECLRPPPARCFCSAPTSSPMVSGHPRSHLDPPNLASHSTSSPTVAAANLDELAKGRIRCLPGHVHLRARRKTPSRLLAPYCEPGTVILRASTRAGMRAARSGVWRAAAFGGRS